MPIHSYSYYNGKWTNDVEEMRVAAGLTQVALCALAGISHNRYRHWTDGRSKPLDPSEIEKLREILRERLRCLTEQP